MPRLGQVFLDQHCAVAEGGLGFAARSFKSSAEFMRLLHLAHAFTAAAGARLDQHGEPYFSGPIRQERRLLYVAVVAGNDGNAGLLHQRLGCILQSHRANGRRRRTDEGHAGRFDRFGKIGVFRQEAVARVNGVGVDASRRGNNPFDREIAFGCRGRPDADRLVGQRHMQGIDIGVGVDSDGADAQTPCGADNTAGDFTAIGNQKLGKHRHMARPIAPLSLRLRATSRHRRCRRSPPSSPAQADRDIRRGPHGWPWCGCGRRERPSP
jgi:hypothetical protein